MTDIVLTPDECQAILNELASRDPVMRMLMQKQAEAAQREEQDKPMRVVGGAA